VSQRVPGTSGPLSAPVILGVLAVVALASLPPPALADDAPPLRPGNVAGSATQARGPARPSSPLSRWLDVQVASLAVRYRNIEPSDSPLPDVEQMQTNAQLRFRVKFDSQSRVTANVGITSGSVFTGTWNDTGIGTGNYRFDLGARYLFLEVVPVKGVVAQAGSLAIVRGESTEITSYDNDGYVTGERVTLRRPRELLFDEISVTVAYLGDIRTPNAFDRLDRLAETNYQQYLVARSVGPRVTASTDLTRLSGVNTWRAAVRVKVPELRAADAIRYEQYVRFDGDAAGGLAITADKRLTKRLTTTFGYAQIDESNGALNGDRYVRGRRVFGSAALELTRSLSLSGFLGRAFENDFPVVNRTRLDLIFGWNVLKDLQQAGWLP
jgi:hypothetical protein